jgi:hypothetical protein
MSKVRIFAVPKNGHHGDTNPATLNGAVPWLPDEQPQGLRSFRRRLASGPLFPMVFTSCKGSSCAMCQPETAM